MIMFKTVFMVQRTKGESCIYTAYFDEYQDARTFAEKEVSSIEDDFTFCERSHLDGSFVQSWIGDRNEVVLNNDAWVRDICKGSGVEFYNGEGIPWDFESYEHFHRFLLKTQKVCAE